MVQGNVTSDTQPDLWHVDAFLGESQTHLGRGGHTFRQPPGVDAELREEFSPEGWELGDSCLASVLTLLMVKWQYLQVSSNLGTDGAVTGPSRGAVQEDGLVAVPQPWEQMAAPASGSGGGSGHFRCRLPPP